MPEHPSLGTSRVDYHNNNGPRRVKEYQDAQDEILEGRDGYSEELNNTAEKKKTLKKLRRDQKIRSVGGEVEMWRSYGVKKKVHFWNILLNDLLAKVLFAAVLIFEAGIIILGGSAYLKMGGLLFCTIFALVLTVLLFFKSTRLPRARQKFIKRLKNLGKDYEFNLFDYSRTRSFWKSFVLDEENGLDFVLKTDRVTYYVKYVTPEKPRTSYTFLSKDEMKCTKHAKKNIYSLIFDKFDKFRIFKISFPGSINTKSEAERAVLLINPSPRDLWIKQSSTGMTLPTGSGEHSFGYYVYTADSFINAVLRDNGK